MVQQAGLPALWVFSRYLNYVDRVTSYYLTNFYDPTKVVTKSHPLLNFKSPGCVYITYITEVLQYFQQPNPFQKYIQMCYAISNEPMSPPVYSHYILVLPCGCCFRILTVFVVVVTVLRIDSPCVVFFRSVMFLLFGRSEHLIGSPSHQWLIMCVCVCIPVYLQKTILPEQPERRTEHT